MAGRECQSHPLDLSLLVWTERSRRKFFICAEKGGDISFAEEKVQRLLLRRHF